MKHLLPPAFRRSLRTPCASFLALLVAFGLLATPAFSDDAVRGLTAEDLVSMERLSDPRVSPDGGWIVFTLRETDLEDDRGRTDLWIVGSDGAGEPRRLTTDPASDHSPRWSADGEWIYFLSARSGSSQVWKLPVAAPGEARRVTDLPLDVGGFGLSPDDRRLAVALEVFPDCLDLACTVERLEEREASPRTGRVYESLFVRHWDTWKDGRRSHLFVLDLEDADATPVDLTAGMDADVPTRPWGGFGEIAWTPDGEGVVFTARVAGREEAWSTNFDLYYLEVEEARSSEGVPRRLTDNPAWDTQPAFTPDGRHLAYLAMERAGFEADQLELVLRAWDDGDLGEERILTAEWDRSVGDVVLAPDFAGGAGTIYVTAQDRGNVRLFALDVGESVEVTELWGEGHVRSPLLVSEGSSDAPRMVFGLDTFTRPVDLFSLDLAAARAGDGSLQRLTAVNEERLAEIEMGGYEQFSFEGWNGETVYGYLVRPAGFEEGRRYPVAFLIHGGPQGSFDNDFHYRWNPQTYAGAGYAVVTIDFHGSTGYGQDFTDSITGHWGDRPLEDLRKGYAYALETWDFLDDDRDCALGASYGGYMINWIAGNWTDEFDCLVNHDGLFDLRAMYHSTEELWFPEWEMGGTPWTNPEGYERFNPARFVQRWQTPMLVIHGALDFRVVETEGLSTFTALQRRGIPSKLLYFPDENHWVLSPNNSIQWHDVVLGWLDRWTAPDDGEPR